MKKVEPRTLDTVERERERERAAFQRMSAQKHLKVALVGNLKKDSGMIVELR